MNILGTIIYFLLTFIFVFCIDFFFLCRTKSSGKKIYKITTEGLYLISRFHLDKKKINVKLLDFNISIINSLIIAFVSVTISLINTNILIQFGIGFVLLFLLIYSLYEIYGRMISKKWRK